ncbi:uncharacterized protein LY79DRAFT_256730 [Colletotrichum navitas]|uniref:Uncharacterized protein n=1 Tax=Colletotrichum navitas TaxID=681940 RepID=A0AAD8VB85_9PEZI|nr:uncharacterized protein LY79DRAFT_256730 [Colletotrichum navitas]KAK1598788.1 hypothetical protein LY79DRAFT_256730 [Colletotrichum navitas]
MLMRSSVHSGSIISVGSIVHTDTHHAVTEARGMRKPRLHLGCGPSSLCSNPHHACHAFLLLFVTGVSVDSLYFDVEVNARCQSGPSQGRRSTGTHSSLMSRRLFVEGSHHVRRTEDGRQGEQLNKARQRLLGPFPRPHLSGLRDHSTRRNMPQE